MRILVTAGNTQTPIDRVRCLTNIFTGRTGAQIAGAAAERGHAVTLITSQPETVGAAPELAVAPYRTFDELHALLARTVPAGGFDAIVHAAAVGDYHLSGTYIPAPDTQFELEHGAWRSPGPPHMINVSAGKIKSSHPELWLRLTPAPKLIDLMRSPWGFRGILVKFKLEVGLTSDELLDVAERSRLQSGADLMVANTLEHRHDEAWLGAGEYQRVERSELPRRLLERIEQLAAAGR